MEGVDLASIVWILKTYGILGLLSVIEGVAYFYQTKGRLQDYQKSFEISAEVQKARSQSDEKLAIAIEHMARAIDERNRVSTEMMMGYQATVAVLERILAVSVERDEKYLAKYDEILRSMRDKFDEVLRVIYRAPLPRQRVIPPLHKTDEPA